MKFNIKVTDRTGLDMKKLFLFMIPLLLLSACNSEKTYIVGEDAFCTGLADTDPESVYCVDAKEAPINGIVIEYYESGKVLRKMTIRNGRENGIEKEYYENGNLRVETNVVDGSVYGLSKLYNEDGKLYMEINWDNGNATQMKVYDESGKVVASTDNL
jgi:antitoxin component YwqK of YwqJK toxin-antitoxin module